MELQSKFIERTNQQYSIRNDGVVVMHYKLTWKGNKTAIGIDKVMRKYSNTYVTIVKEGKNTSLVINTLLAEYFNCKICTKCKAIKSVINHTCDNCKKEATRDYNAKNRHRYVEQTVTYNKNYLQSERYKLKQLEISKTDAYKATRKKFNDRARERDKELLPKYLVSKYLGLRVVEMPDELYEASKTNIKLKRKIKQLKTEENGKT